MQQISENSFLILIIASSISPGFLLRPDFQISYLASFILVSENFENFHLYRNILEKPVSVIILVISNIICE